MRGNITKGIISCSIIITCLFVAPFSVFADSNVAVDEADRMQKLEQQIAMLQDLIQKQNKEIQQIKTSIPSGSERVLAPASAIPQGIDKEDFKAAMKESYPWMDNLKQGGDLRLRYEAFSNTANQDQNTENSQLFGPTNSGTPRDRNRFRIRLRWGVEKQLAEDWKVGFRIATSGDQGAAAGNADPTSTNTTMGGFFRYKSVWFDQAYAIYTPQLFKDLGPIDNLEIGGGKFKNPFEKYSSKMVWDRDVTPEGLYEKTTLDLWNTEKNILKWDLMGGQYILNEAVGENQDAQMFGIQTGLDYTTYMFGASPVESRTGFSFYGYSNYARTAGGANNLTRGNTDDWSTGNASTDTEKMNIFDIYQEFKFYPFNKPTKIFGEFVTNPSPDHFYTFGNSANPQRFVNKACGAGGCGTGITDRDSQAFALGIQVGEAKKKGEWEGYLTYMYIGANATAAAFSDSDMGWYGHTNNKGFNFGVGYAVTDFMTLNWNNWVVNPVEPYNSNNSSSDRMNFVDYRSQLDLVWKF